MAGHSDDEDGPPHLEDSDDDLHIADPTSADGSDSEADTDVANFLGAMQERLRSAPATIPSPRTTRRSFETSDLPTPTGAPVALGPAVDDSIACVNSDDSSSMLDAARAATSSSSYALTESGNVTSDDGRGVWGWLRDDDQDVGIPEASEGSQSGDRQVDAVMTPNSRSRAQIRKGAPRNPNGVSEISTEIEELNALTAWIEDERVILPGRRPSVSDDQIAQGLHPEESRGVDATLRHFTASWELVRSLVWHSLFWGAL